jgi:drug/metabolite transporter (DMT)-like permease
MVFAKPVAIKEGSQMLAGLLLGEQLTLAMCLGGGLILAGIFLCNKPLARVGEKGI